MFGLLKNKVKNFFKKEEEMIEEKLEKAPEQEEEEIQEEEIEEEILDKEKETPEPQEEEKEIEEEKTQEKETKPTEKVSPKPSAKTSEKPASKEKKVPLATRLKKKITKTITLTDEDINPLLEDFEMELIESDVSLETAEEITSKLRQKLSGKQISSKDSVTHTVEQALRETLLEILPPKAQNPFKTSKKPFVIMVVGPNGHGKTTTMIKLAKLLQDQKKKVVVAAADTFRAASIEQLETLAQRINVKVIKHAYGADPAAVCYDAISHAKAKGIDYVILDTAGRSELNKNLMEELKKVEKIAAPDIKIYIGESLAGNAAVEEAKKFDEAINFQGIIMTKADCDVKGGSILSVSHTLKKPILFLGIGQGLDDLEPFDPQVLVERVLGE